MSIEIYYFSGTGNSLYVAKELCKMIPDSKLIPIVGVLDNEEIMTKGEAVGFVFPIYFTTVPVPVRKFLEKLKIDSAKYTFSVATRLGTFSVANVCVNRILRKKGINLDSQFVLNMASNSPTGLKPGKGDEDWIKKINKEKVLQLESEVQAKLNIIKKAILGREKILPKVIFNPFSAVLERIMYIITGNTKTQINFYTDSTCTGCGICEQVCLAKKIKMHEKKPVWQKEVDCYYCYACFNFCPMQSILVKNKYTKKTGRYFHPDVTAVEISGQKQKDA